jgi:hypothetical protein
MDVCPTPEEADNLIWSLHCDKWTTRRISQETYTGWRRNSNLIHARTDGRQIEHLVRGPGRVAPEIVDRATSLASANAGPSSGAIENLRETERYLKISTGSVWGIRSESGFPWAPKRNCAMFAHQHVAESPICDRLGRILILGTQGTTIPIQK